MSLPNVTVTFAPGALLPGNAGPNVDAIIGPCSKGRVGGVQVLVDPGTIPAILGYGPLAELAAQILSLTGSSLVCVPATITAGTIPNSGVTLSNRSAAPVVTAKQLLGIKSLPLAPSSANTGNGRASFGVTSAPVVGGSATPDASANYTGIEFDITTAGAPGTAQFTSKIGGVVMQSGITVPTSTYSVLDASSTPTGLTVDLSVPSGGAFAVGDVLSAVPTQNDGYNVLVTILSVAANGVAQGTISLDGGVTTVGANGGGTLNFLLGGAITSTGATTPALALSGTPSARHKVVTTFTRSGTATGVRAQAGTWAGGNCFNTNATLTHLGTVKITTPATGQCPLVVVAITGTGTAVGTATSAASATGTGTANGTVTINGTLVATFTGTFPATFRDLTTGVVITSSSAAGNLTSGDSFTNAGLLISDNGSAAGSVATAAITTANTTGAAVAVTATITGNGTAAGTASSGSPATGTGTANGTLTINGVVFTFTGTFPATFTDAVTGVVVQFYAGGAGLLNLKSGDKYGDGAGGARTCYPVAQFSYTIDGGGAVTGNVLSAAGLNSALDTASGATATFGFTGTDLYTYDATTASNTTTYTFWTYVPCTYNVAESDGSLTGLQIQFAFGTYLGGDTFAIQCVAPSVISADVNTALDTLYSANLGGLQFQRIGIAAGPATFATVATLATDVQAKEAAQIVAPNFKFNRAFVFGPGLTAATSGATPQDAIDALGLLTLDRVNVTGGADHIVSVLTGRRDLRNCGFGVFPRVVQTTIATDPGYVQAGALVNVFDTTTSATDATSFWDNRVITTISRSPLTGIYCAGGRSLAQPATTYSVSVYGFLADKLAALTRLFSLAYIDGNVPTVQSGSKKTLDPGSAAAMDAAVGSLISSQMVPNLLQSVNVNFSTTADIGNTDPTLPVSSTGVAYVIVRHIDATIAISIG